MDKRHRVVFVLLIVATLVWFYSRSFTPEILTFSGPDSAEELQQISVSPVITSGNEHKNVRITVKEAAECRLREVKLSNKSLAVTGLVSFPGSGNTWTRHLIQQMTGIGTSSVYNDKKLATNGFPFKSERQKEKTIVVKTHEAKHFSRFSKIVLLIRNPYEAFLSYANYRRKGHTGNASVQELIEAVSRRFKRDLRSYVSLTRDTIEQFKGPVHVLLYEQLQTNMSSELTKLAKFLNAKVTQQEIECTVNLQEGNFHRRNEETYHLALLRKVYDQDKLEQLRQAARRTRQMLKDAYNVNLDFCGELENILFSDKTV